MRSQRYTTSVIRLLRWFEERGRRRSQNEPCLPRIGEIAPILLDRRLRQVRKLSKNFVSMTPAGRHLLRIALKKLRYSVDLFENLFDEKDVSDYLVRLEPLQDALGLANDLRAAHDLVAKLRQGLGQEREAAGRAGEFVLGWHERGLADRESVVCRDMGRLRGTKSFWR